jgi:hypothetical protein
MITYNEYVMVTDWEEVEADDFYLSKEWAKNVNPDSLKRAKELQAEGNLFVAYIVPAVHYVIYKQMDAEQVFIDDEGCQIMSCESAVIGNTYETQLEYSY